MTENYDGFGGSGIFFAFLIFALFAFGERFCGLEKQLAACCCSTQNDLNLILSKLPTSGTAAA